jgi:peptidoglycan/LPS O-acetylase OafA/YrhL
MLDPVAILSRHGIIKDMSNCAPESNRIATLDLLRLAAALAVVAFHYLFRGAVGEQILANSYPEAAPYAIYGYLGVNLFFLISGFVIAWSAEDRSWQEFSIARFSRIYPGFIICMSITFAVLYASDDVLLKVTLPQYGANLLVFSPALQQPFMDGAYWSIILELIFYGWVTLALMTGTYRRWKLELAAIWLCIAVINEFIIGSGALRLLFITEYAPLFIAGMMIHHIMTQGWSRRVIVLVVASFVLSCALMRIGQSWMQENYGLSIPFANLIIANAFIHGLLVGGVVLRPYLRTSSMTLLLGGLTYPLYLLHQNIGYVTINALTPFAGRWGAVAAVALAALVLSWAVWQFGEKPARKALAGVLAHIARRSPGAARAGRRA